MITVSILYPVESGARFDFKYYLDVHMPRAIGLLGQHPGFRGVSVERSVKSEALGSPSYAAACFYRFTSADDFADAFTPNAKELQDDIQNYTDIVPLIQFNEILMSR